MSMPGSEPGGSVLIGTVVTPDGWPVPHAVVTIVDDTGSQTGRSTVGHDGRFAVPGLPPGTYTVITAAAGHTPQARTRQVNGAGAVDLGRLVLVRVSGTVLPRAGTWHIDPIHSTISATAVHIGFAKIHGRFRKFAGTITIAEPLEQSSVEVLIDTASIDTDNADRDAHLRSNDFFDMEQFPEITFVSTAVERVDAENYRLSGDLTIKGVTRPVTIDFEYTGAAVDPFGNSRIGLEGKATVNRKDWGVNWNAVLEAGGVLVSEKVTLEFEVSAIKTA